MRVVVISFDALEYDLVEKFQCDILKQKFYGKVDLEPYFQQRPAGVGGRVPLTPHVYSIFYTGKIPTRHAGYEHFDEFIVEVKARKHDTIFNHAKNPLGVDLPAISPLNTSFGELRTSWLERLTGKPLFGGYYRDVFTLEEAEEAYYSYMYCKTSMMKLISKLEYDLVFIYYKEPDKLQHFYNDFEKYKLKYKDLYNNCSEMAQELIKSYDDGKTLILILSDHGTTTKGGHTPYGFWSSNVDLGGFHIPVDKWYSIIIHWLKHGPVFQIGSEEKPITDEEKKIIVERLRNLGYVV